MDEATVNIRIPAMVIQTLAENAIKHGVASVRGLGLITISARLSGDRVLIRVEDNGLGFNMEHKERIFGVFKRLYTVEQ